MPAHTLIFLLALLLLRVFIICMQHLGWPAVTRAKLSSTSYGPQPWDGGDVQWDYANWAHEPESVDGPIYRCEAFAVAFALDCLYSCDSKTNTECSTLAGDEISDY